MVSKPDIESRCCLSRKLERLKLLEEKGGRPTKDRENERQRT